MKWSIRKIFGVALVSCALSSCAYFTDDTGSRALIVGIDYYPSANSLYYCVADATAMTEHLKVDTADYLYGDTSTATVITKAAVLAALSDAANEAPSDGYSVFVFYFSGHGDTYNNGSIVMGDLDYLSSNELFTAMAEIPAMIRVVILDSCYSGAFVDSTPTITPFPDDYTSGDVSWFDAYNIVSFFTAAADAFSDAAGGDLIVMSAAGAGEQSQEDDVGGTIGHGFFTEGLLESIDDGDSNDDGIVTLSEAYWYALKYLTRTLSGSMLYFPHLSGTSLDVVLFSTN